MLNGRPTPVHTYTIYVFYDWAPVQTVKEAPCGVPLPVVPLVAHPELLPLLVLLLLLMPVVVLVVMLVALEVVGSFACVVMGALTRVVVGLASAVL
jgi:hypothetical protein